MRASQPKPRELNPYLADGGSGVPTEEKEDTRELSPFAFPPDAVGHVGLMGVFLCVMQGEADRTMWWATVATAGERAPSGELANAHAKRAPIHPPLRRYYTSPARGTAEWI